MTRGINRLTAGDLRRSAPGMYSDGGGLYLQTTIAKDGKRRNRSWIFRYTTAGDTHEKGLGSLNTVSMASARERARKCRELLLDGLDPIEHYNSERDAQKQATAAQSEQEERDRIHTFGTAAEAWLAKQLNDGAWGNAVYAKSVQALVRKRGKVIWERPIRLVDEDDVLCVLQPLEDEGKKKTRDDLAIYLRGIIEFAEAQKWREHGRPNPARKAFLKHKVTKRRQKDIKRVKAMKPEEVPAFAKALRAETGAAFQALLFMLLTNVDSNNVVKMKWSEIEDGIWTTRKTKGRGDLFEVPLSKHAKALLEALPKEAGNDFVFPGRDAGKGLGESILARSMKKIRNDVTPRGLRPTFKTWASKDGRFKFDVVETAMRHKVGGDIERLYDHNQWLEERRRLMDAWAQYLDQGPATGATVTNLRRA